jgi:hypothetical protein
MIIFAEAPAEAKTSGCLCNTNSHPAYNGNYKNGGKV